MSSAHVAVIGGGLAGLAASVALTGRGIRVSLVERSPRLGGRATSYVLPDGDCIDNCQHVTLGCCTNLADFYRRAGVSNRIQYYDRLLFADSQGRRAVIRGSRLPAPLHLAPSFAAFPLLTWRDKRAIARAMLRIVRSRGALPARVGLSMLEWLKENGQTGDAIDRFWRVVLVSALNEELDRTDAAQGVAVFWKAFLSNRGGFVVGIPAVPLESLYGSVAQFIAQSGGAVRTKCGAAELCMSERSVAEVRLDDGSLLKADYYIAAVPFDRLLKLLPAAVREMELFANLQQLKTSPITSVHLWFDRSVMAEPFVACVNQTIQWVFNKSEGKYLQIVISASRQLGRLSQQEIVAVCRNELSGVAPAAAKADCRRGVVIRENAATFSPEPGSDRWRPTERTPFRNLLLAGDWTQTGWPATMESAVRSGYRAAEAVLAMEGDDVLLVQPELPVSNLARWVSSLGKWTAGAHTG